ncbi:MAG: hypothetical protein LQ339_008865 [Xanthoria mediterranea]|nr:MAG: hypothetical protein LQ339_008865 [Xanthoria mediterranea]
MSEELSGFPTLKPAIVTKVDIRDVHDLGTIHNGSKLTHYGTPSGTIETVPGYEPAFKANVDFGADWLSFDPDGKHARIDLRGMARTEQGQAIDFRYTGVIKMPPEVQKIFNMDPNMATVPFGHATGSHSFLVADPALKDLENSVFVSNGRIKVTENGLVVETRQSLVVASTAMD